MPSGDLTNKENEYLAILYEYLENGLNRVTTTELASKTYVTLGAVSSILKKIDNKSVDGDKLINYMKGYGASLTPKGKQIAGQIIRTRRIGEIVLQQLGFNFFSIQKQIYQIKLTNEVSDKMFEQYFKDYNNIRCSHGFLIPGIDGSYKFEELKSINQFDVEARLKIIKIPESPFYYIPQYCLSKTDYFINIYNNNLVPDQIIRIQSKNPKIIDIETEMGIAQIPVASLANQIYGVDIK